MKKALIILTVAISLGILGGLYYAFAQLDTVERVREEVVTTNTFPYGIPDLSMHPIAGLPIY